MAALRTPLYREYLTPALHRRFTSAAVILIVLSYVDAVAIGDKSSLLWSWFPLGPVCIRTLLLFISALSIFVLRVAQLHIGSRNTPSPFETFTKYLIRLNTVQTLAWYFFSAWWFSEVYMWSVPASADLSWITEGKAWERRKLNERPIYLRSVFFMLAALQSVLHLYYDYDKAELPIGQRNESGIEQAPPKLSPVARLRDELPSLGRSIALRAISMSIFGPILYALFIRSTAWSWSLYIAALLRDIPNSRLSLIPPYHISLIFRTFTSGTLLITLWEVSSRTFGVYATQEPLKKDLPLTSESKDPNGTLLIGLQTSRQIPKSFAFWELTIISQNFETRRKAIFSDIDRPKGSAWNQIMTLSLGNILAISNRIAQYQNPAPTTTPQQQQITIETLPRITSTNIRNDNIFTNTPPPANRREKMESNLGTLAKFYGQSAQPPKPLKYLENQRTETTKYLGAARQKLLTEGQQETFSKSGLLAQYDSYVIHFLHTPAGFPFRKTLNRRIRTIVLGTPYSDLYPILSSITTLRTLALASLTEDRYGRVAKDIPLLIRAFVSTISSIESFVNGLPPHWTDVEFSESDRRVEEVELVVTALKDGLKGLVGAFGMYADELGMGEGEIRAAREVVGMEGE